ncbi:TolC family protein [Variovorax sp. RHLX14]|uniref:TolC family protein n=1 Tax=Variovorax sp. RHLX14 TaxID=1259731 RepID=UPI003F47A716
MKLLTAMIFAGWVLPAGATTSATPPDLPATVPARAWIEQDPSVRGARSALVAAGHTAAMLVASPNEWSTRIGAQRRNYGMGGGDSKEWSVQLERPIRINGKAELDRQLGEMEIRIAESRVGEAIHESALVLLDLWLDGLAAVQTEKLFNEQRSFSQANLRAVDSRKRAGDASSLDVSVASADHAEVERLASAATSNVAKARAKLRVRFPGAQLALEAATLMPDPVPVPDTESAWVQRVLEAADPLRIAEAQLRKAELAASRASADRIPNPTVGVFAASEAFRNERIVGVSVSIPLGGTYRNARALETLQEVEIAREAVDRQRRDLESGVAETYADATGSFARWKLAEQGATAAAESARLTQRAYSLGEADLQGLLLARRQYLEVARAAQEARAAALKANYRLLVDAHLIWDLAVD